MSLRGCEEVSADPRVILAGGRRALVGELDIGRPWSPWPTTFLRASPVLRSHIQAWHALWVVRKLDGMAAR